MYEYRSGSQRVDDGVVDFAASAAGTLADAWGDALAADTGDLAALHRIGVGQGWFELGEAGALDYLVALVRELGRRACPLPVADAYVATQLLPAHLVAEVASGDLRPVLAVVDSAEAPLRHLEGAADATHVLRVVTGAEACELLSVTGVRAQPGLPVPAWSLLEVGPVEASVPWQPGLERVWRLAVAARALAAAARMHELAVRHTTVRRQFGKPIGAFGAVQQRTAACHIDLVGGDALLDEAVRVVGEFNPEADLAAELAVRYVSDAVTGIAFGAQHTLGAVGFFEEHEAAWLFRRVHSDRLLLGGSEGAIADMLVEGDRALPALDLGPVAERFRGEVHALLDRHRTDDGIDAEALRAEMAERGLFALGWPEADGGVAASVEEQVVLHEEMKYAGGPVDRAMSATMLLGHSLLRHGTPEQKGAFLPLIRDGLLAFCLGYSEPEAGSDLASLRTRGMRAGDEWVIDGQKAWTTRAQTASHVWLAVRTDPDATPRHAGITIFLVAMDTPGIEIQQHRALSGEISCTVFYDGVRVPDTARVGDVNGGWRVIADALAAERVVMGGVAATMRRQLDAAVRVLRRGPGRLDAHGRARLSSLAARLQAARTLVVRATQSMEGAEARTVGPVAAVLSGELAEELGETLLQLLGPAAALEPGAYGAAAGVGDLSFDAALRTSPMFVIGGGTNDIQRGIIARALGLPRE